MIVQHCVHAYSTSSFSFSPGGYATCTSLDASVVDTDGYFSAGAPDRITFPDGGVHLTLVFPTLFNAGFPCRATMLLNGSPVAYEYKFSGFAAHPVENSGVMAIWLDDMSPGDYIGAEVGCFPYEFSPATRFGALQIVSVKLDAFSAHVGSTSASSTFPRTYGTTIYDPNGMHTSSSRLTAQKAGYYIVLATSDDPGEIKICQNGSGSPLNGSYGNNVGEADPRMNGGTSDFAVGWFDVGDYVEVRGTGTISARQFIMAYLGDSNSCIGYSYNSRDQGNNSPDFISTMLMDSAFIDTCEGLVSGNLRMLEGYHFGMAKISTDGGTFVQNDGVHCELNGTQLGAPILSSVRHSRGAETTAIAATCFSASLGDLFNGYWTASGTFIETLYAPHSNVFVTDPASARVRIYSFADAVFPNSQDPASTTPASGGDQIVSMYWSCGPLTEEGP